MSYYYADDELLARLLITSWTLATGRTLPAGVPPHLLSEDELISFWADDQVAAAGPASPPSGGIVIPGKKPEAAARPRRRGLSHA